MLAGALTPRLPPAPSPESDVSGELEWRGAEWGRWTPPSPTWPSVNPLIGLIMEVNPLCR